MEKRVLAGLLALFAVAYLAPLGARPLFQPDELRYAEIPREMLVGGDWIVPRLDGLRYFEKPVLGYWLTAASMAVLGENRLAARLPEALSAGLTVLALFLLVRRFGGGIRPAAAAAGVLLTSGMFYALGCFNVLDMPLTMFLSVALVLFYCAWEAGDSRRKALFLALCGAALGCAFLTKGFLAFAVPASVVVPFMLWERRTGKLLRFAWVPALTAVMVALPWSVMIALREPDFWRQFFWQEHVRRFFSGHAQHAEPLWFFLPFLLAGALPWTLFAPAAATGLKNLLGARTTHGKKLPNDRQFLEGEMLEQPLIRFAICWLLFPFLLFSLSSGKLGTYILPCFPPLALLIGVGLLGYFESGRRKAFAAGAWALACLLGACGLALLVGRLAGIRQFPYGRDEEWKWILLLAALAFWAVSLWRAAAAWRAATIRLAWLCAAPCLLMAAAQLALPKAVEDLSAPEAFLARNSGRVAPGAPLFARAAVLHAVAWHFKRADIYLLASTGEGSYGLGFPDAKGRELELDDFDRFVAQYPATGFVTAFMDRQFYDEKQGRLPKAAYEDKNDAIVFAQYRGGSTPE